MVKSSMLTEAFNLLNESKTPLSFNELAKKVGEKLGFTDSELKSKIAQFYTNLSLDGRFVVLSNNFWDLRSRVSYDKVHIDMNDAYNDDYSDEDNSESEDTEKELGEDEDNNNFDSSDDSSSDDKEELKDELDQ